jgi:hypothetical protein
MRVALVAVLALSAAGCGGASASPAPKPRRGLIVPGHSIDRLAIGMSTARVRAIYGRPDHVSHPSAEESHEILTDYRYHRPDLRAEFDSHGKLIAVYAYSARQRTHGGSGVGSAEAALRRDLDGIDCSDNDGGPRWCTLEHGAIQTIFEMKHARVASLWIVDTRRWRRG